MTKRANNRSGKPERRSLGEPVDTAHRLTQHDPNAHPWESASMLRGPSDSSDHKNCILDPLFLKTLPDVCEEKSSGQMQELQHDLRNLGFKNS